MAAFLIARGPSAVLSFLPYDSPMLARPFHFVGVDPNADPGVPLGPGRVNGTVFSRSYTRANISFDCANFGSTIDFH